MKQLIYLAFLVLVCSCNNGDSGEQKREISSKDLKEPLIRINKQKTTDESRLIDKFIERRNWEMTETGTGLRYMIYEEGNGKSAEVGMDALVKFKIELLDGTLCYQTKEDELKAFRIGRDNVESGIHEGITYLKEGDKAKFVIPSHLAHGLTGDLNKIPPQSSLIVDLELVALK